jgi:voltage-gated potassium channel
MRARIRRATSVSQYAPPVSGLGIIAMWPKIGWSPRVWRAKRRARAFAAANRSGNAAPETDFAAGRYPGRKFLGLLIALVAFLVVYPVLRVLLGQRFIFDVLYTGIFLAAMPLIFTQRSRRRLAMWLGIPTLLGVWAGYVLPGMPRIPLMLAFHLVAALFLSFTVAEILTGIFREPSVSADSIYGAFCGYLLVGLIFGHLYCMIDGALPESFRGSELLSAQLQDGDRRRFLLNYFSFITLTTMGYGQITPQSDVVRGLVVVEAIAGQFYIAVLVAELIGKRVAQAIANPVPKIILRGVFHETCKLT